MPQERGTETDATQDTEFSVVWHSITKPARPLQHHQACQAFGERLGDAGPGVPETGQTGSGLNTPAKPTHVPYQDGPRWTPSSALYRSTYEVQFLRSTTWARRGSGLWVWWEQRVDQG